jgi:hypothetical protein
LVKIYRIVDIENVGCELSNQFLVLACFASHNCKFRVSVSISTMDDYPVKFDGSHWKQLKGLSHQQKEPVEDDVAIIEPPSGFDIIAQRHPTTEMLPEK